MNIPKHEQERLNKFYNDLISKYGTKTQSLSRINEQTQKVRFQILSQLCDFQNRSILDIGCGFGDLYKFLQKEDPSINYTGIDMNTSMIQQANAQNPGINFIEADFSSYQNKEKFDIIVASGLLSIKISNHKEIYFDMIKKMYEQSNIAIAFNMLNIQKHPDDDTFCTYSLPDIYTFCSQLTQNMIIRQDYLPYDFTFYLYH